jgi:TonB family protein
VPQIVHTGAFSTGSQAAPTLNRPAHGVQTGGFGDPNGVKGEGKAGARLLIARVGSFDLPNGPGYGNGTGGARGARGTVASVGFGNGIAIGNSDHPAARSIQQGGFGDSRPVAEPPRVARLVPPPAALTPVQVLSKPNPVYTDEARRLKLEGEVLLAVAFPAAGECRVVQVLRGLGHGLDEAAVRAAQQIRFRPATRSGQPVDSTATIHVLFQLAY